MDRATEPTLPWALGSTRTIRNCGTVAPSKPGGFKTVGGPLACMGYPCGRERRQGLGLEAEAARNKYADAPSMRVAAMQPGSRVLTALVFVIGAFAGCIGAESTGDPAASPSAGPGVAVGPAQFDDTTGGIEGTVTDSELQPVV